MSALTLDIGYRLTPLPESEWRGSLTQAQELTWLLISRLSKVCEGAVPEDLLYKLLGLQTVHPFRSRVKHLIEKGALSSDRVSS